MTLALAAGCLSALAAGCASPTGIDGIEGALAVEADGCGARVGQGAATVIADRLAITAAHVVAGATAVEVTDAAGRTAPAEVVDFDPALDLAVLRLDSPVGEPVPRRAGRAVEGERGVVVVPDRDADDQRFEVVEVEVLRSVDIRTTDIYLDADVVRAGFEIAAPIDEGDSGAMVVLADGAAGVVWARSNQRAGRAWAVDLTASDAIDDLDALADPARRAPVDAGPCIR